MSEVAVAFPASGDWTLEDLLRLPETGYRYEVIEGSLLVTPPPGVSHAVAVTQLTKLLLDRVPDDLFVFATGPGVRLARSVLIPDVLVATRRAAAAGGVGLDPLDVVLVVEVLSPSNRMTDLVTKRAAYAAGGIPHYWVVDPDAPSLLALELHEGSYREVATVRGDESYAAAAPFEVTVSPSALCRP